MKKRFYRPWFLFMIYHIWISVWTGFWTQHKMTEWQQTGLFGLEVFHKNFKGMEFFCLADIIHRLEWRKAASYSRGKELLASQNTGKKHQPRAMVLWKTEAREGKRSVWLAIKTCQYSVAYTCSFSDQQFGGSNMSVAYTRNFVWWLSTRGTHINLGSYV